MSKSIPIKLIIEEQNALIGIFIFLSIIGIGLIIFLLVKKVFESDP
ncbi:hypothetical protein HYV79_04475 [Candidatus Woesearchaeota archaeon]|nr:hypothetical protein [Candidatus Woesearchaeota archaeon]